MSYGVEAFLVPEYRIKRVASGEQRYLAECLEALRNGLARLDEPALEPGEIASEQAVREIFAGRFSCPEQSSRYGQAFLRLCRHWAGRTGWLSNTHFYPVHTDLVWRVGEAAIAKGLPLDFYKLIVNRPPIE